MSEVRYVERLDLAFAPKPWAFADERRAEIDEYFRAARQKQPSLWNGRLLMMHEFGFREGAFHGAYLETDFASFLAWRDWDYPDPAMRNCFSQAALRGSDGAFVLGVMADHTANAGRIYFPSGTPDLNDVAGNRVDLDVSVARELTEEAGLSVSDFDLDPGWFVAQYRTSIATMKVMQARETAQALGERIGRFIAAQAQPELSGVVIARGPDDLDARMRPYVTAFLRHIWRG